MTDMTLVPAMRPGTGPTAVYLERMMTGRTLRLGARTSPMAVAQARQVAQALHALVPEVGVKIMGIVTSGDQWKGDLAALDGKGAFMKEIDRALLTGQIDAAMHCMKDVPSDVPMSPGVIFAAYLPREDIRDCLVFPASSDATTLAELPPGSRIGTSSVRRRAQLAQHRPELAVHRLRGNVNSRIARLDEGAFDALVLARAGLDRIGHASRAGETLRTMLHGLQGHCNSPIAGHCATTPDGRLALRGMVFTRDGGEFVHAMERGPVGKPAELGAYLAGVLLRKGARDLIEGIPH
jgi:hydroxymethylbilane synthase